MMEKYDLGTMPIDKLSPKIKRVLKDIMVDITQDSSTSEPHQDKDRHHLDPSWHCYNAGY